MRHNNAAGVELCIIIFHKFLFKHVPQANRNGVIGRFIAHDNLKMRKPFMNIALILGMFPGFMSMIAVYYILKGLGFQKCSPPRDP